MRRWLATLLALAAGAALMPAVLSPATATATASASEHDEDVLVFGDAGFHGSPADVELSRPIVGMAVTPTEAGYWLVASDGGIFSYGDAGFEGSAGAIELNSPIVGIAPTATGEGYWLVATDGGIFSYGDARFHGSAGAIDLNSPIVAVGVTPTGAGYWLAAADGGIFSYGDARFFGSAGAIDLNSPIVGMAATPTGAGYWLTASDGGIFSYGDAAFHGSAGAVDLSEPIAGMAATPTGDGYWLLAADGGVFAYGEAAFHGSGGDLDLGDRRAEAIVATSTGEGYWIALGDGKQLPRGGHRLFPTYRTVLFYGRPGDPRLGTLGAGTPDEVAGRLEGQAAPYGDYGRPLQPGFEVIASLATAAAGADGDYSSPIDHGTLDIWLAAARRHRLLLILDIQPGRADFLDEVRRYERFLIEPEVGVALDPEWSVRAPERPGGGTIGSTDGATVNRVADYLAGLVQAHNLPEKLLIVHQFTHGMVRDRHLIRDRPELAITFHADGFGGQAAKRSKYDALHGEPPFESGIKVFYRQDSPVFTPAEVMGLSPRPDLVTYQ